MSDVEPRLRLVPDVMTASGEEILQDGAAVLANYLMLRLNELPADDPWRAQIEDAAFQLRGHNVLRNLQMS